MLDLGLLAGYIKKQWIDLRADSCWDEEVTQYTRVWEALSIIMDPR